MRVPSSSCSIFPRTLESLARVDSLPAPYPACPNFAFLGGARVAVTPGAFVVFTLIPTFGVPQPGTARGEPDTVLDEFSRVADERGVDLGEEFEEEFTRPHPRQLVSAFAAGLPTPCRRPGPLPHRLIRERESKPTRRGGRRSGAVRPARAARPGPSRAYRSGCRPDPAPAEPLPVEHRHPSPAGRAPHQISHPSPLVPALQPSPSAEPFSPAPCRGTRCRRRGRGRAGSAARRSRRSADRPSRDRPRRGCAACPSAGGR